MQQPSNSGSSDTVLLRLEDVTKVFNIRRGFATTQFHAVDEATFTLDQAKPEILSIAGESGSGKTTLARMLLGMDKATRACSSTRAAMSASYRARRSAPGFSGKFSRSSKIRLRPSAR